jgi:TRAP-type C4-dicarboxylate transport system permease small subunit
MEIMEKIRRSIDKILVVFSSAVLVIMVFAVVWQVFSRYVLNAPSTFTDELSRFGLIWVGLLGASYAFGQHAHLAINLIEAKMDYRKYYYIEQGIYIITLLFLAYVMVFGGLHLSAETMGQISPSLKLPMGVVYGIIPFAGVLNCGYALLNIFEARAKRAAKPAGGVK